MFACSFVPHFGLVHRNTQAIGALRAHLSCHRQYSMSHQPQVDQRKTRLELRRVLLQSPVARLGVAELPLEHPERMFDLGPHAGLQALDGVDQLADPRLPPPFSAHARLHCHAPVRPGCIAFRGHQPPVSTLARYCSSSLSVPLRHLCRRPRSTPGRLRFMQLRRDVESADSS